MGARPVGVSIECPRNAQTPARLNVQVNDPDPIFERHTVLLKRVYAPVFIEHGTRRLHLGGVTAHPTGAWALQQARNLAVDLGDRLETLRFLIHDRGPLFTTAFGEVCKAEGLRILATLPQTPRMNAVCERVIGTLRRELLDRILILGERHLALVLGVPAPLQRFPSTNPGNSGHRILKPCRPGTRPASPTRRPSDEDPS